jgi:hypothetical protein
MRRLRPTHVRGCASRRRAARAARALNWRRLPPVLVVNAECLARPRSEPAMAIGEGADLILGGAEEKGNGAGPVTRRCASRARLAAAAATAAADVRTHARSAKRKPDKAAWPESFRGADFSFFISPMGEDVPLFVIYRTADGARQQQPRSRARSTEVADEAGLNGDTDGEVKTACEAVGFAEVRTSFAADASRQRARTHT